MKTLLYLTVFLVIVFSISKSDIAFAGVGDTITYRLLSTTLLDSTIIRYELGAVKLIHAGSYRYLDFINKSPYLVDDYFTTDTFTIAGSTDSIAFSKFASFDDKHIIGTLSVDTTDHHALDSIYTLIKNRYHGLSVVPDTLQFASNSSIVYSIEVLRKSDDAVLGVLDSLICYVNGSGQLRFKNIPPSFNLRKVILPNSVGTQVYLHVHTYRNLPLSASILGYSYRSAGNNVPATTYYRYENQENLPLTIPLSHQAYVRKDLTHSSGSKGKSIDVFPNPAKSELHIAINEKSSNLINGSSKLFIVDDAGTIKKVFSANKFIGDSSLLVDIHDLPSGSYEVILSENGNLKSSSETGSSKFQIIH